MDHSPPPPKKKRHRARRRKHRQPADAAPPQPAQPPPERKPREAFYPVPQAAEPRSNGLQNTLCVGKRTRVDAAALDVLARLGTDAREKVTLTAADRSHRRLLSVVDEVRRRSQAHVLLSVSPSVTHRVFASTATGDEVAVPILRTGLTARFSLLPFVYQPPGSALLPPASDDERRVLAQRPH